MNQCTYIGITPAKYWTGNTRKQKDTKPETIIQTILETFVLNEEKFYSKEKPVVYSDARMICAYLIKKYNPKVTHTTAGKIMNRHHTTITYYLTEIQGMIQYNKDFKRRLSLVEDRLC